MKSTTFVLGAFLASVAIAQPHKQHLARHHHNKRANAETTVVVTDWVYEYETVGVTTTIWVSPGFVEPEVTSTSPKTTTPEASSTTSQSPAQFFEPASSSAPKPTPSTTSTTSSSTSTPVYVAPTPSTTSSVYVPPVVESSSSTSVYFAPAVTPTTTAAAVVYTPPEETTTSAAAPAATSNTVSGSGSSSGVCSSGSPCTGDITYYEAGLGACGLTNDGSTEKVVALPYGLMGTQSNGNPYCGKTITVSYGGKTTTATVVDKCMGCVGDAIDLSNAAFLELAELAVGRATAEWWFN